MPAYRAPAGAPIWCDLMSSDPVKAAQFYCDLFGWTVDAPRPEFGGYQNFRHDGSLVAGLSPYMQDSGAPANLWSIYLHAPDIAATVAASEKAGATVIAPPMRVGDEGTLAILIDPAGAAIGFWQPDQHGGYTTWGEPGTPYWFESQSMNYAASTAFYRDVLGARMEEIGTGGDPDSIGPDHYTQIMLGSLSYAGIMDAAGMLPDGVPSTWQVYITVDDVFVAVERVTELGGTVLMPGEETPYGTLAVATDPLGAVFCMATPPEGMSAPTAG